MSTAIPNLEELSAQTQAALAAGQRINTAVKRLPQALWAFVKPYWGILSITERAVDSSEFNQEAFQRLHDRLLPLERMADEILAAATAHGYSNRTLAAGPLLSLQLCNERVKDCMVALESMLDPRLDDLMAAALDEHRKGETVPVDSTS